MRNRRLKGVILLGLLFILGYLLYPAIVSSAPVQQFHGVFLNRKITYDATTFIARYEDNFSFPTDVLQNYNYELKVTLPNNFSERIMSFPENFSLISKINVSVKLEKTSSGTSFVISLPPESHYPNLAYYNFTIGYRLFLKPKEQGYFFNVSIPYSFETNFKVDAFAVEIYSSKGTFLSSPPEFNVASTNTTDMFYKGIVISRNMDFMFVNILQSYNFENYYVFKAFIKTIQVNPILGIKVSDKYSIQVNPLMLAFGSTTIPLPAIYLPRWIQGIYAEDSLGPIDSSLSYVANTTLVAVNAKSRFNLMPSSNYSFSVVYYIPFQNTSRKGDLWEITIPFSSNVSQVIPYFELEFSLPVGASLKTVTINETNVNFREISPGKYETQITNFFVGPSFNSTVKVLVNYSILWAGYPIGMIVLLFGLFVFAVYYTSKIKVRGYTVQEEKVSRREYPEITQLKKVFRNYLDDYSRMIELEYRYFEGKISRREFKSVFDKIKGNVNGYEREISRLLKNIRGNYPELVTRTKNVENLVLNLQAKSASFREMGLSYMSKRITKESFSEHAEKTVTEITDLIVKIRSEVEVL